MKLSQVRVGLTENIRKGIRPFNLPDFPFPIGVLINYPSKVLANFILDIKIRPI